MTRSTVHPLHLAIALAMITVAGCAPDSADRDERIREMEARFTPGLHSLMAELGTRHGALWFAGEAGNWPLAGYMVHELEELVEEIEQLHPVYHEVQVAAMLRETTMPAVEQLEEATEAGDGAAFAVAFDRLTAACNQCHAASGRGFIVMQRPATPPYTNLRFAP